MDMGKYNNMNDMSPIEDDDVIDVAGYLSAIFQHRIFIVLCAMLMAMIAGVYSKFYITPTYQSTADVYVLSSSDGNKFMVSLSDLQAGSNLQEDYIAVIQQREVLDEVIEELGLDMDYKELSDNLTVSAYTNRIISISVTNEDAKEAKRIVDSVADVSASFIEEHMKQTPPSVLHYGYDDGLKVGPKTRKNALAGGLIGLVLAILLVVVYKILHNTIESAEDIERKLGLSTLAVLPLDKKELNSIRKRKKLQ